MSLRRIRRCLTGASAAAAAAVLLVFCVASAFARAHLGTWGGRSEAIEFVFDHALSNLALGGAALAALLLMRALLERFARVRLTLVISTLWIISALVLVMGLGTIQLYDARDALEAARLFAGGNYKMLSGDYLNTYPYQLGFILPMEIALRVLRGADLNLLMQAVNVFLSVGTAGVLAAFSQVLTGEKRAAYACAALYLLALPGMLFCTFVYGVLPMLFFGSLSLLCFAQYVRTEKKRFGLAYGACLAAAYMLKPNAAILLIAMGICATLDALEKRSAWPLAFALLAAALSLLLSRAAVWQYELRAGIALREELSMTARLAMGLQRGGGAAGWFNRYTEKFYPLDVTMARQMEIASADLRQQILAFAADPSQIVPFFSEKLFSQWLEPTYSVFWQGALSEHTGTLETMVPLAPALFAEGGALRALFESYFAAMQRAMYALALVGALCGIKRREDALQALLPTIFLGGAMYHLIFEAKSQYAYVYAVLLVPLAAQGMGCVLGWMKAKLQR